jgi:hypothetical protein
VQLPVAPVMTVEPLVVPPVMCGATGLGVAVGVSVGVGVLVTVGVIVGVGVGGKENSKAPMEQWV